MQVNFFSFLSCLRLRCSQKMAAVLLLENAGLRGCNLLLQKWICQPYQFEQLVTSMNHRQCLRTKVINHRKYSDPPSVGHRLRPVLIRSHSKQWHEVWPTNWIVMTPKRVLLMTEWLGLSGDSYHAVCQMSNCLYLEGWLGLGLAFWQKGFFISFLTNILSILFLGSQPNCTVSIHEIATPVICL